ncbi:MAG: PhzF family phenazine biosynthesis protein [Parvibaculum sp.]
MAEYRIFQVDAFADRAFEGNPAAVVPLESWLPDEVLQAIAMENNLAETAYFVPKGDAYELRWFTPSAEVPLCGHATLASAHVLYTHLGYGAPAIGFDTKSGRLTVRREGARYAMDFPTNPVKPTMALPALEQALGAAPAMLLKGKNYFAVFEDMREVAALRPDVALLTRFSVNAGAGVIATAPGDATLGWDCASRFFAPHVGILEDPVTGSAHTSIVPFWAKRLKKDEIVARQISRRGGTLFCSLNSDRGGDRVIMRGTAVDYLVGVITV